MLSETICFVLQEDDTSSVYTECEEPDQLFSLPPIRDEWRTLFDMFDPEGFGEIPLDDFEVALDSREFITNISPGKIIILKVTRNRITLKKFYQKSKFSFAWSFNPPKKEKKQSSKHRPRHFVTIFCHGFNSLGVVFWTMLLRTLLFEKSWVKVA